MLTVYTFGDSLLDCGQFNDFGLTPGQLLVTNDDRLFPEFRGRDLTNRRPIALVHRARAGATVNDLAQQLHGLFFTNPALALLTIGGNDLLKGLIADRGPGRARFAVALERFLQAVPIRPVLIGTIFDPTFGDDQSNFTGVEPALARANLQAMNDCLAELGQRYGRSVDLHRHFLSGDLAWFTHTIEPSLVGASEIRRCFLQVAEEWLTAHPAAE